MDTKHAIEDALLLLGELLAERNLEVELAAIGGGALVLQDLAHRPTADVDIVARRQRGIWRAAKPLPADLLEEVRRVGHALGLQTDDVHPKNWLNSGPAFLFQMGLPAGFFQALRAREYGGLILYLPTRQHLICLKVWAATAPDRVARRAVDMQDLKGLTPTLEELELALAWASQADGRPDFLALDGRALLVALGHA